MLSLQWHSYLSSPWRFEGIQTFTLFLFKQVHCMGHHDNKQSFLHFSPSILCPLLLWNASGNAAPEHKCDALPAKVGSFKWLLRQSSVCCVWLSRLHAFTRKKKHRPMNISYTFIPKQHSFSHNPSSSVLVRLPTSSFNLSLPPPPIT